MGLNHASWFISSADSLVISSSTVEPWKHDLNYKPTYMYMYIFFPKKRLLDFSSGPMAKTLPSNAES